MRLAAGGLILAPCLPCRQMLAATAGHQAITDALAKIRQTHRVPAIAGAIVTSKGLSAIGVTGVRKVGTDIAATLVDQWHLGSDTKAMTAVLIGHWVERKKLAWDSPMREVLPTLAGSFHRDFAGVTIRQLLQHRAGLPANLNWHNLSHSGTVMEQRVQTVREAFTAAPLHPPGSKYLYSNLGYVIAGAIVEAVAQKPWEEAITEIIFQPLKMTRTGFGGLGTPGQIDQPWGHVKTGKPVATNGPNVDNPPVMGPAGRVHATMQDWAQFIADTLRGARGQTALLQPDTYKTLHAPPTGDDYALGWLVVQRGWGGGTVLNHAGCNTMFYANAWVAPRRDFAVLVCINQGDDTAAKAADAAASALIKIRVSINGEK